jgi:hypothetical protein
MVVTCGRTATRVALTLGLAAVVASTVVFVPAAAADAIAFEAVAAAEGARLTVAVKNFLVVERIIDGGGPVAQAALDSLGNSKGFASNPYPGEAGLAVPGLLAAQGAPSSSYPFIAESSHPARPESRVGQPPYELVSRSGAESTTAEATAGGRNQDAAVMFFSAKAETARAPDGSVTAEAVSRAESFSAGPLRIGRVVSRAKVVRSPGRQPVRESELVVENISIGDQSVAFTQQGLALPGATVPIPPAGPLAEMLAAAGMRLSYLAPVESPDGVAAPGLEITAERDIPGVGRSVTTHTLGRASVRASVVEDSAGLDLPPEVSAPGGEAPAPTAVGAGAGPDSAPAPATGIAPDGLVFDRSAFGSATLGSPGEGTPAASSEGAAAERAAQAAAPPALLSPEAPRLAVSSRVSTRSIFAVLGAAALLALAATHLVRVLAVRSGWTS